MISSPRILRPFTITLIHKVDEDTFIPYVLENVGFDENYGITQSNKGYPFVPLQICRPQLHPDTV